MTCLDEGTLQAYLDGELSPETLNGAAAHLAACAPCAEAARAAEQELALFSTACAPALAASSVPTAALRARLDNAIAELNASQRQFAAMPAASRVSAFFASLVASLTTFTPRQATAFASFLVAAIALAVVFFALMRTPGRQDAPQLIAQNNPTPASPAVQIQNVPAQTDQTGAAPPDEAAPAPVRRLGVEDRALFKKAVYSARPQLGRTGEAGGETVAPVANAAPAAPKSEPMLEDEKTYLTSIASLTSAIEAQGAQAMSPTLRAEYERNLAVVNQAIVSSRVAAWRNPQDTDVKEFLRSAYQNKVELLSAVADQAQLASSRD